MFLATAAHFDQAMTLWGVFGLCVINYYLHSLYCLYNSLLWKKKNKQLKKKHFHLWEVQNSSTPFETTLPMLRLVHPIISVLH